MARIEVNLKKCCFHLVIDKMTIPIYNIGEGKSFMIFGTSLDVGYINSKGFKGC